MKALAGGYEGIDAAEVGLAAGARPDAPVVVVVDDEPAIVELVADVLRADGYAVHSANHPGAVLGLDLPRIDVLVTDYRMPDLNGIALYRRLVGRHPDLVGVLLTGFGSVDLVQRAMQQGFGGILLKPFPLDSVAATVERALSHQRLHIENNRLAAVLETYATRQHLARPRSRTELLSALGWTARQTVGAREAAVLLTDGEGRLTEAEPAPDWARAFVGQTPPGGAAVWYDEAGLPDLVVPLRYGELCEGVVALRLSQRQVEPGDMEQLLLLTRYAALALTDLRLFEERLREDKLALVGRLAGLICQRIRQPLGRINAALAELPETTATYSTLIADEAERLELMCDELSDLVDGTSDYHRQPTSLAELVEALARRVGPEAEALGVEVELALEADVVLSVDETKLSRALYNLVRNAFDAMPDGGRLRLGLRRDGGHAVVEVADTGCGMAPDVRARLFEPFFTHGKSDGTGLGGAIVHGAVKGHGGEIDVDSSPGQGSRFRLLFPLPPARREVVSSD